MTWLVTGGAGYIGAHVVRAFQAEGIPVAVIDDLSSGHASFVPPDVRFVRASLLDADARRDAFADDISGVVHLAGYKYAGKSVEVPLHTYEQNVEGTRLLLATMTDRGVDALVFSSSAGVYGTPDVDLVTETTAVAPESPYGESKLVGEWMIRDVAKVTPLRHTSLRYFNVVGSGYPDVFDTSPHNLFPLVLKALTDGQTPWINGDDYATPDGTCVRDYLHVADLARAHVTAARALEAGKTLEPVYNLGSGDGLSVRQIMAAIARVTGHPFEPAIKPRRPGDPARIVASGELATRDLAWEMRNTVDDMVASAWKSWSSATAT